DGERYAEHELNLTLSPRPSPTTPAPQAISNVAPTRPRPHPGQRTVPVAPGVMPPTEVFISSCPSDRDLCAEVEKQLVLLKRHGLIRITSARTVGYGKDVRTQIEESIEAARFILLMLSPDYLAWDYCDDDLGLARERLEAGA